MGSAIRPGCVVSLEVSLWDEDGHVLEATAPGEELVAIVGSGTLLPGLERALLGRAAGDSIDVTLPPEEAYGYRDEALVESVPRARLATAGDLAVGERFEARTQSGRARWALVVGIEADGIEGVVVRLDLNHPLAGRTLRAAARVIAARPATPAELAAGRALPGLGSS